MTERPIAAYPIAQLTLVRLREFVREPEAVFWTFLFPVVLTVALGLAFRSRPEPVLKVAATSSVARAFRAEPGLDVIELPADAARSALSTGKVALAADSDGHGGVTLSYDDTNPEGRSARALAD